MLEFIIKSLLIGFCAAVPLGPVAILCIQKNLSKGLISGYSVGLGSSLGDLFYATIAVFSLTFISKFLEENILWILIIGGALIIGIGIGIALTNPAKEIRQPKDVGGKECFQSAIQGFFMTLSNPGALFLMLGLVAFFRMNLSEIDAPFKIPILLIGLFTGSNLWWFIFSSLTNTFRHKIILRQLIIINRIAGIAIAILGFSALIQGASELIVSKL